MLAGYILTLTFFLGICWFFVRKNEKLVAFSLVWAEAFIKALAFSVVAVVISGFLAGLVVAVVYFLSEDLARLLFEGVSFESIGSTLGFIFGSIVPGLYALFIVLQSQKKK